jgi:hypothetical protein
MRLLVLFSCALFLCAPAFCQKELKADLLSPQRSAEAITTHLMLLVEKTHEPASDRVSTFARDLVSTLGKRPLADPSLSQLVTDIASVIRSAGTSTLGFHDHVADFALVLKTLGVQPAAVRNLAGQLEAIGRQVRGPEDTPVRPAPARMR